MHLLTFVFLLSNAGAPPPCSGPLTREVVIACARASSPSLLADRERVAGAMGDEAAARVLLPSNPEISFSAAHRQNNLGDRAVNFYGGVTQEVEVAGQRRKRIAVARAERETAAHRAEITERDVIAQALLAWYEAIAARREIEVVEGTTETAVRLEDVASGRAKAGASAPIEVDLAAAEAAGLREQAALARGRANAAEARLAILLGLEPDAELQIRGELEPLPSPGGRATDALGRRPELAEAAAQRRSADARIDLLRRLRAPNPKLAFIVQLDGYRERVLGGGVTLPIPLPSPLGRTYKGEIQAARARSREADARATAVRREITLEVAQAKSELAARQEAAAAYPQPAIDRARTSLRDLADQAAAGRLDVRQALVAQRILLQLLLRQLEAVHALCRSSVELARAEGRLGDVGGAR